MIKKEITFIYSDAVEKQVAEMIAAQAEKRGYQTVLTDDPFTKAEIGWYTQHINFPQYSKFSVIMLHDIIQQYGNWPDIWYTEPWNKYDIGFLPSLTWKDNWDKCSQFFYARPRKGMYLTGWPKADRLADYRDEGKRKELAAKFGLKEGIPTILYAPAWENDGKQDDFVQAMLKLNVNILIKQAPWSDAYPEQIRNVNEMRELHKNIPGVYIPDPRTNILDAIMVSDVLVSEESSTMCEAVMLGKPAVSVRNWLIPYFSPSRFPSDNYEFAIHTNKEDLADCISNILEKYEYYAGKAKKYSDEHFSNIGHCIPMMLDILDSHIEGTDCKYKCLVPANNENLSAKRMLSFRLESVKREIYYNYRSRSKVVKAVWDAAKGIKDYFARS